MKDVQVTAYRQIAHVDKLLLHGACVTSTTPTLGNARNAQSSDKYSEQQISMTAIEAQAARRKP